MCRGLNIVNKYQQHSGIISTLTATTNCLYL